MTEAKFETSEGQFEVQNRQRIYFSIFLLTVRVGAKEWLLYPFEVPTLLTIYLLKIPLKASKKNNKILLIFTSPNLNFGWRNRHGFTCFSSNK